MRRMTLLGMVVALGSGSVAAQDSPAGLDSASIAELKPERLVRIQVPEFGRIAGRVRGMGAGALVLDGGALGDRSVRLAAVDSLWVRGRRTATGAIIGGVIGAVAGGLLGALADGLCEYDCGGNSVVPGALLGAAVSGGAGALLGAAIPRWRRIFPR